MPDACDELEHGARPGIVKVVERPLAPDRAGPARTEPARQVGQVPRQDLPQPADQLRLGPARVLVEALLGFSSVSCTK
jgi:hypothetical protein